MNLLKRKINLILSMAILCLLVVILFFDTASLNTLIINYDDSFVINEISLVQEKIVDNNEGGEEQVVSDETIVPVSSEVVAPVTPVAVNNNVAAADYWAWPTDTNYTITSMFGYRWGSHHDAVDISGPGYGSNIYAANNGVVTSVKGGCVTGNLACNGRGGNYIVINHNSNNYYTIYMHLKDIYVSVGQTVSRGQVIGTMGNTGNVVPAPTVNNPYLGTHLHFGLYIGEPYNGGYAVDPMRLY